MNIYKALAKHYLPPWLKEALLHVGVKEVPGKEHAPEIQKWLRALKAWWSDDETPWCGVFVAEVMRRTGHELPKHWYRALAWADWGKRIDRPRVGCVVVFSRKGGGHVGLVVGVDQNGRLLVLGGNQGNAVRIDPFDTDRVVAYVVPLNSWLPDVELPRIASELASSRNEA